MSTLGSEVTDEPPSPSQVTDGSKVVTLSHFLDNEPVEVSTKFQWNDWRWQMRNRIRTLQKLVAHFKWPNIPVDVEKAAMRFPMAITPYYASLIRRFDSSDPIFLLSVPQVQELDDPPFLRDDPLEEDHDMPVPGLVHRYPDRALLVATSTCAMYCRHCTRKRVAGQRESTISPAALRRAVGYLKEHPEIHDVIVSGGDPLTLATDGLERILSAIREVPTVDIIRIGTRTPVTLPMRITDDLVQMLRRFHPLWINTHFNHPNEITPQSQAALNKLADAGIPMGNQSVLLRGINDDPQTIETLCRMLVRNRVRPYYLFQCDLVRGVEHFRTPLSRGIEIMEYLRGRLSGLAIPTFVVDAPHGGGKIPVLPTYIISQSPTHTVLRNYEGILVSYPEPGAEFPVNAVSEVVGPTVSDLNRGKLTKIGPSSNARQKRRAQRIQRTGMY